MGAEDSRPFVPEAGDEEQVQPYETKRRSESSRADILHGERAYRSRDVGTLPSDTGQPRRTSRELPTVGRPPTEGPRPTWEETRSGGARQTPGTGGPWETTPGREVIGPGQIPSTGRPWEIMPGREVIGPGQIPGTGGPWETTPGREVIGPGQIPGTGRPWETIPGREIIGPGQIPGTGRPWETMPGREVTGPGQIPGTGRPWETMPGREVIGTGQIPGTGRPWETTPGRELKGPGQIPGTGRPREIMPGREVTGPGQIPGTGRPWETIPGREVIGPGQIPGTGRPREIMPGREVIGPGQIPGTGRPREIMPGKEVIGPGQIPGESRSQPSVAGSKRETHRERLLRERRTIEGHIEEAKTRLNKKMEAAEEEMKALSDSHSLSSVKKEELERKMHTARVHFLQGVQKVNQHRDATFGRLLKKIEEIEDPQIASSRMDWEEIDDLIVNMMMFYSEILSELENVQEHVNAVKRTSRSTTMQAVFQSREMSVAMRVPSSHMFPQAMKSEGSSSLTGPNGETIITIDEKGGFFEFSNLRIFLQIPPNTVSRQTNITCKLRSKQFLPSPAGNMETVVSHIVELGPQNLRLQQPIIATLLHSGPGGGYGYETIVKAFSQEQLFWEELEEYKLRSPTQRSTKDYIRVRINNLTVMAAVSRLITDRFEVTPRGSLVRSSVCEGVMVQFAEGAVTENVSGSLQVLMIPKGITTNGYPCPILFVHGFEGINFRNYVSVRIPHPCPTRFPVGQVNLMCLKQNQWSNITNQTDHVICVEQQDCIELHVQHFSGLWTWLRTVPPNFGELFRYLCQSPQAVCFAAFKENYQPSLSPKITLLCVANHDEERMQKMKGQGYGRLARTTARRKMRPNDSAFMKLDGEYQVHWKDRDFSLQFLYDEPCIRELSIERKQEIGQADVDSAILSFYPNHEFAQDDLICILDVKAKIPEEQYRMQLVREIAVLEDYLDCPQQLYNAGDSDEEQGHHITSIISSFGAEEKLLTITAEEVAQKLPIHLNVSRVDQQDPSPHVMKQCRIFCRMLKDLGRQDIVDALRKVLPAGMTGPVSDGNTLVRDMNFDRKTVLTRHLSVTEKWKPLAQELGVNAIEIQFFEARTRNHSMAILEKYGAHLTVNQLYKLLVRIGANAIADHL